MTISEKLHKLERGLLDSKDDKAAEKAQAEKERDIAAEERLRMLQSKAPAGDNKELSSVPRSQEYAVDETDMPQHNKATVPLHHRAEDTALRPESQEHANGVGTAGDDLAI